MLVQLLVKVSAWYDNFYMKDILRLVVFGGLFIIPFLTLVVTDNLFFPYITGKNFAFRIIVEGLLASWFILALLDVRYRPKFSYILATFTMFMGVMLLATIFAQHSQTAWWSNYERMEGYIGLLHIFGYFIVLGSVMTEKKHWWWFFHITVVVATVVALLGLSQLASATHSGIRVDATLGNSTYMAIYMLFHLGFLAYLFIQTKKPLPRIIYTLLAVLFVFILIQTGTRGTALGLVASVVTAVGYISLFGSKEPALRRYASGAILLLIILGVGFVGLRKTDFVQDNSNLARIANINLKKDLAIRSIIWQMAGEGVKERPILGWGMGNYNYIFNQQYDPRLYAQEQWFDRVHNIIFDWLVAGGILGFLAYVSLFLSLLYYLFIRPYFYNDQTFSVTESAILIGLVVGYVTHNLVVFDNIVSYIFFATVIAYIHSKVAHSISAIQTYKISPLVVTQVVLPITLVGLMVVIYLINVPAILAARDIIDALQETTDLDKRYTIFTTALTRGSFAQQEIVEQFVQQAILMTKNTTLSQELKIKYLTRAEQEIQKQITVKPNDARLYVFAASFYRTTGQTEKATVALASARSLSPRKQSIILQQGVNQLTIGNNEAARDFFAEAFTLNEEFTDAREYYVATLFLTGATSTAHTLIAEAGDDFVERLAQNDFLISAVNSSGDQEFIIELLKRRVVKQPTNIQAWTNLAILYYQNNQLDKALDTLNRGADKIPSFKTATKCIRANMISGLPLETACRE